MFKIAPMDKVFLFFISAAAFFTPLGKGPANTCFAIAVLVGVALLKKNGFVLRKAWHQPLVKPLGLLLFVIFITTFFSTNPYDSFREYPRMLAYVSPFVILCFLRTCQHPGEHFSIRPIMQSYVAGCALSACYGFYQFAQTKHLYVTGFYMHHAMFGAFLEIAIPVAAVLLITESLFYKRCMYAFGMLLYVIGLILSQARGPWGGALVGLIVVGYILRDRLLPNKKTILVMLSTVLLLAIVAAPLYINRVKTLTDPSWPSNYIRLYIWQSTLHMMEDYPLTGVGLDQFSNIYNKKYINPLSPEKSHPHAHNSFLMLGAETGVVSLCLFFYLVYRIFVWLKFASRNSKAEEVAAITGLIAGVLVNSMVDNFFWAPYLGKIIWLFIGLSVYMVEIE